jgi:hypothetical protein
MSKFGAIIENAKNQKEENTDLQKAVKPESSKTRKPEIQKKDESVNLTIKVPASKRRHWVAESKRQGTSVTAIIIEALEKKFGNG